MVKIRINDAIAYAKASGKRVRKVEIAQMLWKDSRRQTAHANMVNLCNGKTRLVNIEFIPTLCRELGVSADYLFGLTDEPTTEAELSAAIRESPGAKLMEKIKEILPELDDAREIIAQTE